MLLCSLIKKQRLQFGLAPLTSDATCATFLCCFHLLGVSTSFLCHLLRSGSHPLFYAVAKSSRPYFLIQSLSNQHAHIASAVVFLNHPSQDSAPFWVCQCFSIARFPNIIQDCACSGFSWYLTSFPTLLPFLLFPLCTGLIAFLEEVTHPQTSCPSLRVRLQGLRFLSSAPSWEMIPSMTQVRLYVPTEKAYLPARSGWTLSTLSDKVKIEWTDRLGTECNGTEFSRDKHKAPFGALKKYLKRYRYVRYGLAEASIKKISIGGKHNLRQYVRQLSKKKTEF